MKEDDFTLIRKRQKEIHGHESPLVDNAGSSLAAKLNRLYREANMLPVVPWDLLSEHQQQAWQRVASGLETKTPRLVSVSVQSISTDQLGVLQEMASHFQRRCGRSYLAWMSDGHSVSGLTVEAQKELAKRVHAVFPFMGVPKP